MTKLCEYPIDVLRGAIRSYREDQHPPTGKMGAEALVAYMREHKKARMMLPKTYRQDKEVDIPLSLVRKTILDYRRKYHPAPSRMRRAELESYLRRVKIKPVGKELPKLKRDQCEKPTEAPQPRRSKRKQASVADEEAIIAAASELTEPVTGPKKKKKRGRPRKSTLLNTDAGLRAVEQMLPDLAARAAQMDADDDSLAW
jgi:hypothetical protein